MSTGVLPSAGKQIDLHEQPKALRPMARLARRMGLVSLVSAFVLLILFLVVWYGTPYYLRDYLEKRADALPDYKLTIHWLQINPIACSIDLENIVLEKKSNLIPVPFFASRDVHIAMQWTQLIHLSFRSNVTLHEPVVNFVNGPTPETSQTFLEPIWVTEVKQLVPLEINQFKIHNGDIHYYDFHAEPEINLQLTNLELVADNLSNATHTKDLMPTTVTITGHPVKVGELEVHLSCNTDLKQPTFSEKVSKEGSYDGYLKPFFQNLQFEPMPKDRSGLAALWATLLNGVKGLIQDDRKVIATQVPVTGQYKDPNVDIWAAAFGILKNAWIESLKERFNSPEIAPGGKPPDQPKLDKPVPPRP
jgi:hypothetical protein